MVSSLRLTMPKAESDLADTISFLLLSIVLGVLKGISASALPKASMMKRAMITPMGIASISPIPIPSPKRKALPRLNW